MSAFTSWRRRVYVLMAACVSFFVLHALFTSPYVYYQASSFGYKPVILDDQGYCDSRNDEHIVERPGTQAFVVASTSQENSSWLEQFTPMWERYTYVVDDQNADFTVPRNKGREAMVYLTFIIDHYHGLPEVMLFLHASQYQWHNEDPFYDGVPMLQRLQLDHVRDLGFTNVRCTWELGCPPTSKPFGLLSKLEAALEPHNDRANMEASFSLAYSELFPELAAGPDGIPTELGAPAGAQFAVTADQIRRRPLCEYERYRDWLLATTLPDSISGRIFEISWHIVFGQPAVNCPDTETCFCKLYGLCNLKCTAGECAGRYWVPPSYRIPAQWPTEGPGTNGLPTEGWWEEVGAADEG